MARANFVKKARKANPEHGIEKGDSYYWWKFRYGGIRYSKTAPKRSQLTQSGFLFGLYDLEDRISEFSASNKEDFDSFRDEIKDEIDELKSTCEESLENMPEQLRESNSGSMLQERIDGLDNWSSEIENIEVEDYDEDELRADAIAEDLDADEDAIEEKVNDEIQKLVDAAIEKLQGTSSGL